MAAFSRTIPSSRKVFVNGQLKLSLCRTEKEPTTPCSQSSFQCKVMGATFQDRDNTNLRLFHKFLIETTLTKL